MDAFIPTWNRTRIEHRAVPVALATSLVIAVALAVVQPLDDARNYLLAVRLVVILIAIWFVILRPRLLVRPAFLAVVFVAGIVMGVAGLATIDADAEIVHVGASVIATVHDGDNPYTSGTVYHRGDDGQTVMGDFNYPPLELYPVLVASHLAGRWDATVLAGTIVALNLLACAVLAIGFRRDIRVLWPWLPLLALTEVKVNVSMTFLLVALALWAIRAGGPSPSWRRRLVISTVFGLGLATKFLMIPIFLAHLSHRVDLRRLRTLRPALVDALVASGVLLVLVAPFGPIAVFRSTVLFNLRLEDRAVMATFYPNVVSGLCEWIGAGAMYPLAAGAVLLAALLVAPRLDAWAAMLVATYAFLLAASTPEPQYVPIVLMLALVTASARRMAEGSRSPG